MEHIKLFESFLNESDGREIKVGDIIKLSSGKPFVVLETPVIKMSNKYPIKFLAIHSYDLENVKKGDQKSRRTFTVQMKPGSYTITGKVDKKDVDLAKGIHSEIVQKNIAYTEKNYSKIEYDTAKRQYYTTAQDGTKVYAGDKVFVKFSNGNFAGIIKQIAGTQTGEIMVVFPGRSKARGVKPENILKKAN